MLAHTFNPSTPEFETSLIYKVGLRTARATQWDRISKRKSKTKQKTLGLCSKQWFKCYWGSRVPLNILALQKAYPMPSWHSIAFHYLHRTKWSHWGSCCRPGVQLLAFLEYTGQNRIVLSHTLSVHTLAKTDEKKIYKWFSWHLQNTISKNIVRYQLHLFVPPPKMSLVTIKKVSSFWSLINEHR